MAFERPSRRFDEESRVRRAAGDVTTPTRTGKSGGVHPTPAGPRPPARRRSGGAGRCWWRLAVATLSLFLALPAGIAAADAAGPTDYLTRIVGVDPAAPQVHARIVGGDSFLLLRVDAGTEVEVLGYRSEPYIRFLADGTVQENRASASFFVSRSRLGSELPSDFDASAEPDWHDVGTSGEYAWHDHRTHWMGDGRPPGKRPGDVILRQDIELVVDGAPVTLTVESVWMPAPSGVPAWLGRIVGVPVGLLAGFGGRIRWRAAPALVLALLATAVGAWQYRSLPAQTGPRVVWVLLPAVAAASLAAVCVLHWRRRAVLTAHALMLLGGVNLVLWGWMRRDGLSKAILPTHAPGWLDRAATAAAATSGVLLAAAGLVALVRTVLSPAAAAGAPASKDATSSAS